MYELSYVKPQNADDAPIPIWLPAANLHISNCPNRKVTIFKPFSSLTQLSNYIEKRIDSKYCLTLKLYVFS